MSDEKVSGKKRATRVAERVREEMALALTEVVKDPGANGVIVSSVKVADDLRLATIYFRLVEGGDNESTRKKALAALARASGVLRREVTERAGLRFAPELRFFYDEGLDARTRIDELLAEVEHEKKSAKKDVEK